MIIKYRLFEMIQMKCQALFLKIKKKKERKKETTVVSCSFTWHFKGYKTYYSGRNKAYLQALYADKEGLILHIYLPSLIRAYLPIYRMRGYYTIF